jgi:hypothetical protein
LHTFCYAQARDPPLDFALASFKTTRIINAQSIENMAEGALDFKISHRFGMLNSGAYEFF